jgi:hypothetical protein
MSLAQIVLALVLAAACAYTVAGYPRRYGALSGRSRLFRTVGLFLLDLLLFLVLLGTMISFTDLERPRVGALRAVAYLLACVFLLFSVICIALLDWLESLVAYRRAHREMLHRMAARDAGENENEERASP